LLLKCFEDTICSMRKSQVLSGVTRVLAALTLAATLWAHHSPSAVFDMSKRVVIKGTLTKVEWVNPHIDLMMDVKNPAGAVENWKFESNPPSWFRHVNVGRSTFVAAVGQEVTVECVLARDGSHYGYMNKITFADGNAIELAQGGLEETKK
jgi:hypothetical protein